MLFTQKWTQNQETFSHFLIGEPLGITTELKISSQVVNLTEKVPVVLGIWQKLYCLCSEQFLF
jgi:hypothetical protein